MITEEIRKELFALRDGKYCEFQSRLIPSADGERFIGVRTPDLRRLAKVFVKREGIEEFLSDLPHRYFDEDQLHAFIISEIKDFERCAAAVETFLPYVDNWATCDQMSPKSFKKHRAELLPRIDGWIASGETYTVRFGIGMLMEHFLDEDFDPSYLEKVASVRSDEYYVMMMAAWYFATALAKRYDETLPYLEGKKLDVRVHNKTIQKAVESRRISPEQKDFLKSLKIK